MDKQLSSKRVLLLTDWVVKNNDWSFLRELLALGYQAEAVGVDITRKYGSRVKKVILLWSGYVLLGLKGFLRRKDFDVVIAYQGVAGLFYSFFRQLFLNQQPELILMGFFYKKRHNKFYASLRYYFTRAALAGVDKVVCLSTIEADHYNEYFKCQQKKFFCVPLSVNVERYEKFRNGAFESKNYILTAGSSNRDYKTFFEAIAGIDRKVVVFAKKYNVAGLKIPENVEMIYDVYGDAFLTYIKEASFVVVPLEDADVSSGILVLLESMALGKAVVISDAWCVSDYVEDGKTAVISKIRDAGDLRKKIESLLDNQDEAERLGRAAQEKVMNHFAARNMALGVSELVERGE